MKFMALLIAAFLMMGCVPITVMKSKDYIGKDYSSSSLYMLPLDKDMVEVTNIDDVKDDFGEESEADELIANKLNETFAVHANNLENIRYVVTDKVVKSSSILSDDNKSFSYSYTFGTEEKVVLNFRIPKKETLLENSIESDFVFVINNVKYDTSSGSSGTWTGNSYAGGSFPSMICQYNYILWDYQKNAVVACGNTEQRNSFFYKTAKGTWEQNFRLVANKIFKGTPFKYTPVLNEM